MTTSKWIEKRKREKEKERGKAGRPKHSRAKVYFNFDVVGDTERWPKQMAKYGNRENDKAVEELKKRREGEEGEAAKAKIITES